MCIRALYVLFQNDDHGILYVSVYHDVFTLGTLASSVELEGFPAKVPVKSVHY